MEWGDYINLDDTADVEAATNLLSKQIVESVDVGLQQFDASKPFRLGWYIEQD